MTLRAAYVWGLGIAIELSLLAVLLGGELPVAAWSALAAPPASAWLHHRRRALHGAIGTSIGGAAAALGVFAVIERGIEALIVGATTALVGLLVGRLLTRETLTHDLQALLASLLLVLAGSVLHTQLSYGFVLAAYTVAVVWALIARQLVEGATRVAERDGASLDGVLERRDVATPALALVVSALALVLLASTAALFVTFPRIGIGSLGFLGRRSGGFPADIQLGGIGRAASGGGTVLARIRGVTFEHFQRGLYVRGPVYDALASQGFQRSAALSLQPPTPLAAGEALSYEVFMQPLMGEVLLTLGPVQSARITSGGLANPSMQMRLLGESRAAELLGSQALTGAVRYQVRGALQLSGAVDAGGEDPSAVRHYLALPVDLDPRIGPLAARLTAGVEERAARAAAIKRYLRAEHRYTLDNPNGAAADPLAAFLFDDPRGHCEYFASAYAALLRAAGIPSRVVGGLHGGRWDDDDRIAVFTSADAHAWVEWFAPGAGWVLDDATPASNEPPALLSGLAALLERASRAWDDYVLDYGIEHQIAIVSGARSSVLGVRLDRSLPWRPLGAAAILLLGAGGWLLWRRRRRAERLHPVAAALLELAARRRGEPVPAALTVREALSWALPEAERQVVAPALELYEAERFGGRRVAASLRARLLAGLGRL